MDNRSDRGFEGTLLPKEPTTTSTFEGQGGSTWVERRTIRFVPRRWRIANGIWNTTEVAERLTESTSIRSDDEGSKLEVGRTKNLGRFLWL